MRVDGAADQLKPEQDAANAAPNWYISGYGRFWFSSKADAEQAIKLAQVVADQQQSRIARAIDELIG